MNPALKSKLQVAVAGGALAVSIAGVMLSGKDGLEGREYVPYNDVGGVLTVCDGHTGKDIVKGKKYSDSECDAFLKRDLEIVAKGIDPAITVTIPETTRAALYSFTYNVGVGAFKSSTLLKKLNAGDTSGACDELHRWIYAAGKKWKGLQNRRDVEHEVCSWQPHPIPLVVENGHIEAVEAPIQPDHSNWFVAAALAVMAAVLGGMAVILWRLRNLLKSHDRDPRPDDSTESE